MSLGRPPNVLWIVADQLRYHALACHGDPNVATPAIDSLAAGGVDCSEAVSQYPVCTPFRAGLMTGQHAHVNGVMRHGDFLDPSKRTVAHAFNDAGYRTSFVGKWHLAPESGAAMVDPRGWAGQDFWVHPQLRGGFQDWFGFNISNNYYETYVCSGEKVEPRLLDGHQTDALTDLSIEYLEGRASSDQPWFHVISYEAPHPGRGERPGRGDRLSSTGYPVPERYESLYDPASLELRPNVPSEHAPAAREQLAGYYRMITHLDDNIGRLLSWLEHSGQANDTLVVFLSDHGEMGGSHGLRNKQVPYEESLHIPLIFRPPGWQTRELGASYDGSICGVDIAPTTLGLCGLSELTGAQGRDFSLALTNPSALQDPDPARDAVLVQWNDTRFAFGDHPYRAIRTRSHTYAVGRDKKFCLLFDRAEDPYELRNLYRDEGYRDVREALGRQLLALLDAVGEPVPEYVFAAQ